ncbi:6,7-dimethyl-8-ribityllumazine synthase [Candidatus Woesearchaeota archaeon]|jgi:6,7-dimethyl-8-ribityllumazine synthase|nr:6,7-dimethyl-8-ribityllumazine synthase [Candidatus Woesearchaeota archaeon]MDP6648311.1 6,7-dimethyl-8-ribityllumazine synthase [Candidatus Woesearchaeota archaeon]|tara:strand:+ start:7836 stop:8243 length:408 start_codon:yes stop_codon:yes gene_type:complete
MTEKLGMVVSQFNYEITGEMSKKSQQRAKEAGARIVKIIEVPGSFEIPLAVKELLNNKSIEGVITLGTVIKGGTDHDAVVAHAVAKKLIDLSVEYGKPVSLGISGPNITWQQSEKRIEEYAIRAVDSVIKMLRRD